MTNLYKWRNIAVLSDQLFPVGYLDLRARVQAAYRGVMVTFRARAAFYNVLDIPFNPAIGQIQKGLEKAQNHSRSKHIPLIFKLLYRLTSEFCLHLKYDFIV